MSDRCDDCGQPKETHIQSSTMRMETCIENLQTQVAHQDAEIARLSKEHERDVLEVIDERDHREEQIVRIHRALGGDGEWCARVGEQPPNSGDLGEDSVVLAEQTRAEIARLREERRRDALDGQATMDEAYAEITRLRERNDRKQAALLRCMASSGHFYDCPMAEFRAPDDSHCSTMCNDIRAALDREGGAR